MVRFVTELGQCLLQVGPVIASVLNSIWAVPVGFLLVMAIFFLLITDNK